MFEELKTLDPEDLPSEICKIYEAAIPVAIKRIVGIYPWTRIGFKANKNETFQQNADRFREYLKEHYRNDIRLYESAHMVGGFHAPKGDVLKFWKGDYSAVRQADLLLQYVTDQPCDYAQANARTDPIINQFRPPYDWGPFAFNAEISVGGRTFAVTGYKNGNIRIRGLTEADWAKIEDFRTFTTKIT